MSDINPTKQLRQRIAELEIQQKQEGQELKQQFLATYQSLRMVNIIKSSLREVVESKEIREDLLSLTIIQTQNLVGRFLQKVIPANEETPIRSLIITLLKVGAGNLIASGFEKIKKFMREILNLNGEEETTDNDDNK